MKLLSYFNFRLFYSVTITMYIVTLNISGLFMYKRKVVFGRSIRTVGKRDLLLALQYQSALYSAELPWIVNVFKIIIIIQKAQNLI